MISHKYKTIFIHIPKCGGQSVENIFLDLYGLDWSTRKPLMLMHNDRPEIGPPRLGHLMYQEYVKYGYITKELMRDYRVFTVVRDPYKRMESLYRYSGYSNAVSFKKYICAYLPKILLSSDFWFYAPQYKYLVDEENAIKVNDIVRLEYINRDLPKILELVGVVVQNVPHSNKSTHYSGRVKRFFKRVRFFVSGVFEPVIFVNNAIIWDKEMVEIVDSIYGEDFRLLGYDKKSVD